MWTAFLIKYLWVSYEFLNGFLKNKLILNIQNSGYHFIDILSNLAVLLQNFMMNHKHLLSKQLQANSLFMINFQILNMLCLKRQQILLFYHLLLSNLQLQNIQQLCHLYNFMKPDSKLYIQDSDRLIKQQTWMKFKDKFKLKYKKQYHSDAFIIVSSLSIRNKQSFKVVSIGCGTKSLAKCLITEQNKKQLIVDMHAQILAIQGFKRFVLKEISKISSQYFEWNQHKLKYSLKDCYQIVLYVSEIFCGDACINEQLQSFSGAKPLKYLYQQSYTDMKYEPNILRTKPGRIDLPLSKRSPLLSCSDLIGLSNILGIQGKKLFSIVTPIYISQIIMDCPSQFYENIRKGINLQKRLHLLLGRKHELIHRQIFNIIIEGKQKTISSQFRSNQPVLTVLQKINQGHSRDKQGFQLCVIIDDSGQQWINGKTGLPQGSSLKNYKTKGKISRFCEASLQIDFKKYQQNIHTFKYEAIESRLKWLFGQWTDVLQK